MIVILYDYGDYGDDGGGGGGDDDNHWATTPHDRSTGRLT